MRPRIFSLVCLLMTVMMVAAQNIKRQEYWIDSDYGNRQSMGTSSTPSATISTAGLSPGVHFFNHRAMNSNNEWGTLYRYMFFIPEQMDVEVAKVEYWIDNDYKNVVRRQVASSSLDCILGIRGLASGLHFFNFRPVNAAGDYGVLRRTAFFIPAEETADVAGYEYWIDNDTPTEVSDGVNGSFYTLIIDLSELAEGEHTFSFRAKNVSNVWGDLFTQTFTISGSTDAEPYAVFNNGTLTFYCDNRRSSREGTTYDLIDEKTSGLSWLEHREDMTKAVFDASFSSARPKTLERWFNACISLKEIQGLMYLNTSEVTSMGHTFGGCSSLTSLDVSNFNTENVTSMNYMFGDCSSLTSLDVSNFNTSNVKNMGSMFYGCSSFTSLDVSNFNTENVTDMRHLFANCSSLSSLDVSNFNTAKVTNMSYMFSWCNSLINLDVSNFNTANVTEIDNLFNYCGKLSKLTLGNSFTSTEEMECIYIFNRCSNLDTIAFTGDIPASINSKFFKGVGKADAPATLDVPEQYKSNYAVKFSGNMFFGGYFTLGGAVDDDIITFADAEVKRICVENWDTNGDGELSYDEAAAVTDLGEVFKSKRITSFDELQYFTGLTNLSDCAFQLCMSLTSVKLPIQLKTIGHSVFANCYKLQAIELHEGLEGIDWSAFFSCRELKSVVIPSTLTQMGITSKDNPFSHCYLLDKVSVAKGNPVYDSRNDCNAVIETATNTLVMGCNSSIIPEGIVKLGPLAFAGYTEMTHIELPSSVKELSNQVFIDCKKLESVDLNCVETIGYACFSAPLKEIYLPATVKSLYLNPFGVFYGTIEKIVVDPNNPYYDSREDCNAIILKYNNTLVSGCKNTRIPKSVKTIGDSAFEHCRMSSIDIPEGVESIRDYAFYSSTIDHIKLPKSLTFLDGGAFYSCKNLTEVIVQNAEPLTTIDEYTFSNRANATLYVPKGSKALYEAADIWKEFKKIVEMEGEEPTPEPDIVRNVVMEEATGTWCGWCIRGIVAMKQAKEQFGDRFIGIAVHGGDVMSLNSYYDLDFSGYPSCCIDRDGEIYDPSYLYVVRNRLNVAPTVAVSVKGEWNVERTMVTATSETQFLADGDGYQVAYVLVADGLTGTSSRWNQNNAYSGSSSSDPDMQAYCEKGSPVTDMVYNDVMVGSSYSSSGLNQAESFGGAMKKGDKRSNSYTLSLPVTGELAAAIDKNQVYVVAIVTNPDGTIANAAKAKVGGKTGDVNGDNTVDVADIASLIDVMAKGTGDAAADVNGDGVVDVADIATIIDIMAELARLQRLAIEDN